MVIPSGGGNTSAYLATERYCSMPFQPSACHNQYRLVPVEMPENGTTGGVVCTMLLSARLLMALIFPSARKE
ncbi:hypothetical protein [Bacteroides sp. ET336]|uniref:hypothetical protein n=1 Tax=Bacteroides sp. ET336 TaxID=2972459 RepID=UPI0021ABC88D|nr:hypothetical protein [Bacteroides sp. ET336]